MSELDLYTDISKDEFYNDILAYNGDVPRYIQNELHDVLVEMYEDGKEEDAKDVIFEIKTIMDKHGVTVVDVQGPDHQQRALVEVYRYMQENVPTGYWENTLSNKTIIDAMDAIEVLMRNDFYTNDITQQAVEDAGGDIARLFRANVTESEAAEIASQHTDELIEFLVTHADDITSEYAHLAADADSASILVDAIITLT